MARGRGDRWLLLRLAAQNLARRRLRAIFLGAAVMIGVGVAFASFVAGWALRAGMITSLSRMGADLVVVPSATLVNITSSLLTVQPTDAVMDASMAKSLAAIPGVAKIAPQRIISSLVTEQLPAGAGRFVRTNILKYDIVCDVAACGAEVAPRPEVASPVALTKFGELHLNAMRGPALNPAYEIADRNVRRYLDEHVDMLSRQNP